MISTNFVNDIDSEIERLAYTSMMAAKGFYTEHGFRITNEINPGSMTNVYLPSLEYSHIPNYWKKVEKLSQQFPLPLKKEFRQEIEGIIGDLAPQDLQIVQQKWQGKEVAFWKFIRFSFPKLFQEIESLEIRLTSIGTGCSYSLHQENTTKKIVIYLRWDIDISHIAESVLSAIFSSTNKKHSFCWEDTESTVDLLMTSSVLADWFPEYQPTLEAISPGKVITNNNRKYLEKLGCPFKQTSFTYHNDLLVINGVPATTILSPQEVLVLNLFINSPDEIIKYDDLADAIWSSGEDFSLWAINRCMSRIRKKLQDNNLGVDLQNIRGVGYILQR